MNMQPAKAKAFKVRESDISSAGVLRELSEAERRRTAGRFRAFEVCVFNQDVLESLKNNEEHPFYNERWCEAQNTIVLAYDEIELALKLRELFPAKEGFVIKSIIERRLPDVV
ncbi:MAG: hypothetical protein HWE25_14860 [Alphaproteobacteria bacterium]|nr:hypothetical protein [Alphaproteobacteria bacterium]